jgi:hypothetical protein
MSGDLGGQECSAKSWGPVRPFQHCERLRLVAVGAPGEASSGGYWKLYAPPFQVVRVSFMGGSWLQRFSDFKSGPSFWNTLYLSIVACTSVSYLTEVLVLNVAWRSATQTGILWFSCFSKFFDCPLTVIIIPFYIQNHHAISHLKFKCPGDKEANEIWVKRKVWKEGDMTKSEVLRCLEGLSETMGNLRQASIWSQDLQYEAQMLPTWLRCSVIPLK